MSTFQIWIDADACPNAIKEILFRVAERRHMTITLVANKLLRTPPSRFIKAIQVPAGFDVADQEIIRLLHPGDLVITADIPLAAQVLDCGGDALNPRGEFYNLDNIQQHLAMRKWLEELRGSGVDTGGPAIFSQSDRHHFAAQLDRHLQKASI
ncbi:YaiI/YqxD family protein [Glaciimonas sp. Gout2]|uniref:YaiI/YqxD family protein n=2 Tax=Glaciimonas TaxID=1229970 RepID=UPI002AB32B27|nr:MULTISPECIES: YaiI/YqxD family protein [unclassified Glaciimonas]MDY7545453.1 YaiI/YqxD family protein [Glaciimonas sp. CA11.2]MEB0013323.1 YaiI/YqxD family protein [Glaciimonas sp. Cout2]MEB0082766.1 YaiI/YqxD family protein [Glaciimonas sp. Gout2]